MTSVNEKLTAIEEGYKIANVAAEKLAIANLELHVKTYPFLDQNRRNLCPFSDQNRSKTIHLSAAYLYS